MATKTMGQQRCAFSMTSPFFVHVFVIVIFLSIFSISSQASSNNVRSTTKLGCDPSCPEKTHLDTNTNLKTEKHGNAIHDDHQSSDKNQNEYYKSAPEVQTEISLNYLEKRDSQTFPQRSRWRRRLASLQLEQFSPESNPSLQSVGSIYSDTSSKHDASEKVTAARKLRSLPRRDQLLEKPKNQNELEFRSLGNGRYHLNKDGNSNTNIDFQRRKVLNDNRPRVKSNTAIEFDRRHNGKNRNIVSKEANTGVKHKRHRAHNFRNLITKSNARIDPRRQRVHNVMDFDIMTKSNMNIDQNRRRVHTNIIGSAVSSKSIDRRRHKVHTQKMLSANWSSSIGPNHRLVKKGKAGPSYRGNSNTARQSSRRRSQISLAKQSDYPTRRNVLIGAGVVQTLEKVDSFMVSRKEKDRVIPSLTSIRNNGNQDEDGLLVESKLSENGNTLLSLNSWRMKESEAIKNATLPRNDRKSDAMSIHLRDGNIKEKEAVKTENGNSDVSNNYVINDEKQKPEEEEFDEEKEKKEEDTKGGGINEAIKGILDEKAKNKISTIKDGKEKKEFDESLRDGNSVKSSTDRDIKEEMDAEITKVHDLNRTGNRETELEAKFRQHKEEHEEGDEKETEVEAETDEEVKGAKEEEKFEEKYGEEIGVNLRKRTTEEIQTKETETEEEEKTEKEEKEKVKEMHGKETVVNLRKEAIEETQKKEKDTGEVEEKDLNENIEDKGTPLKKNGQEDKEEEKRELDHRFAQTQTRDWQTRIQKDEPFIISNLKAPNSIRDQFHGGDAGFQFSSSSRFMCLPQSVVNSSLFSEGFMSLLSPHKIMDGDDVIYLDITFRNPVTSTTSLSSSAPTKTTATTTASSPKAILTTSATTNSETRSFVVINISPLKPTTRPALRETDIDETNTPSSSSSLPSSSSSSVSSSSLSSSPSKLLTLTIDDSEHISSETPIIQISHRVIKPGNSFPATPSNNDGSLAQSTPQNVQFTNEQEDRIATTVNNAPYIGQEFQTIPFNNDPSLTLASRRSLQNKQKEKVMTSTKAANVPTIEHEFQDFSFSKGAVLPRMTQQTFQHIKVKQKYPYIHVTDAPNLENEFQAISFNNDDSLPQPMGQNLQLIGDFEAISSRHRRNAYFFDPYEGVETTSQILTHSKGLEINLAFLMPITQDRPFCIQRVEPAIKIAIEKVQELQLLPEVSLKARYSDSKCSISDAMNQAINFYHAKLVDVFIGPVCDYAVAPISRQVRYWNIPQVTPGALAGDYGRGKKSMFPLLTRVGTNFNALLEMTVKLLRYFNWSRIKIIYRPDGFYKIMDRFCHVVADAIVRGLMMNPDTQNITSDHRGFHHVMEILENLDEEIGNDWAGKSACL